MSNNSQTDNQNSGQGFGLGILLGSMVGIATYYMFGTKQGDKLRQKFVEEFEYAKVQIPKDISKILEEEDIKRAAGEITKNEVPAKKKGLLAQLTSTLKSSSKSSQDIVKNTADKSSSSTKDPKKFFTKSGQKLN